MNKEELERMLEEQANASHKKQHIGLNIDRDRVRGMLNVIFLVLAFVGLVVYFYQSSTTGLIIIGISLVVKVLEFLVRFLL